MHHSYVTIHNVAHIWGVGGCGVGKISRATITTMTYIYDVISTFYWVYMIISSQKVFDVYLWVPAHPILVPIKVTASHFISDRARPLSRKYNSMCTFTNHVFNSPIPHCFKNMDVTWMKARWLIHQYFWSANSTILSASNHKLLGSCWNKIRAILH